MDSAICRPNGLLRFVRRPPTKETCPVKQATDHLLQQLRANDRNDFADRVHYGLWVIARHNVRTTLNNNKTALLRTARQFRLHFLPGLFSLSRRAPASRIVGKNDQRNIVSPGSDECLQ